jgi:FkbM family methyltransferase
MSIYNKQNEHQRVFDFFQGKTSGFFIEVGANEPVNYSQTYHLEQRGWKGILVEPQPDMVNQLKSHRNASVWGVACGAVNDKEGATFYLAGRHSTFIKNEVNPGDEYSSEIKVPVVSLNYILEKEQVSIIDFLSIDVEGFELNVLKGFDIKKYRPKLILLEDHIFSLKAHRYLKNKDYKLIRRTGQNNWYVPSDMSFVLSLVDRIRLTRKMYIGTPIRMIRHKIRKFKSKNNFHPFWSKKK